MYVGSSVATRANRAGALRVKGAVVVRMHGVAHVEPSRKAKGPSHACGTSGQHAVVHVDAAGNTANERGGVAHAHKVAGLVLGHVLGHQRGQGLKHHLVALPHRVTANAIAREVGHVFELVQRPQAQVKVHTALYDSKERLRGALSGKMLGGLVSGPATLGPQARELDGALHEGLGAWVARALVELHHYVGAKLTGNVHILLGAPVNVLTVIVDRTEGDALVCELDVLAVAKHLESARVGEDRSVPLHELVQAAHLVDKVRTGTH